MANVLVVDDDTSIRETLRMLMEEVGHTVTEASDGAQALAALRAAPERLVVLLDLVMPQMDGQEVLRQVANDPRLKNRHSFVVLTAGNTALVDSMDPYDGVLPFHVLRKPFDIDELMRATDRALALLVQPARG